MRISVIGAGYVGLTQAAGLAYIHGHEVLCIDNNVQRIQELREGKIPIHEPGLDVWIKDTFERGKQWTEEGINFKNQPGEFTSHPKPNGGTLYFSNSLGQAIAWGEVIFICVGTPPREDGSVDISALEQLKKDIWPLECKDKVFIIKSTVPPGTTRKMFEDFPKGKGILSYAMNPEFLREGHACEDFQYPDRIIIGYEYISAGTQYFDQIYGKRDNLYTCTTPEAELTKYASNAFLSMKISFAHEVQNVAVKYRADPMRVLDLVGRDKRVGSQFLHPGIGYGGSCFPKDTKGYIHLARQMGIDPIMIVATENTNDKHVLDCLESINKTMRMTQAKNVGLLGCAFKEDTDDIRESKALELIKLIASGKFSMNFKVHDPKAIPNTIKALGNKYPNLTFHEKLIDLDDCDFFIVLTPWKEYATYLGPKRESVLDLRNMPELRRARGPRSDPNYFTYGEL